MKEIMEKIKDWAFLSKMPKCIEGFSLSVEPDGFLHQHRIFIYENNQTHRSFSVYYDEATKKYLAKITIGLTEFCDVAYITGSLEKLENLLAERMENTLRTLCSPQGCEKDYLGCEFLQKNILQWPYSEKLPNEIYGFELFINPRKPVRVVNGSYIIIDYSDFQMESSLSIYYNIFRDEFFGELKLRRTPVTTAEFDAKTLPELEERINSGLKEVLTALRSKL